MLKGETRKVVPGAYRNPYMRYRTWAVGLACAIVTLPVYAFNIFLDENSKSHGLPLDGKNRVELVENDGWITIWLKTRERGVGGEEFQYRIHQDEEIGDAIQLAFPKMDTDFFELNPDLYGFKRSEWLEEEEDWGPPEPRYRYDGDEPDAGNVRYGNDVPLVRVHSEVLASAPPNYVKNPGLRYRISVEGLAVGRDYQRMFEVDAHDAVEAMQSEIMRIANNTFGITRDALFYGSILTVRALNESAKLPADIPDTILRSEVGQIRILGQGLQRGTVSSIGRFSGAGAGQDYARNLDDAFGRQSIDPELVHGPARNRTNYTNVTGQTAFGAGQFDPDRDFKERDRRANVRTTGQQRSTRSAHHETVVNHQYRSLGRSLDKPQEEELRPIYKNEIENREILFGPVRSTAEVRAEGGVPGRLRRLTAQDRQSR